MALHDSVATAYREDPTLRRAAVAPYRPYDPDPETYDGPQSRPPAEEHPIFAGAAADSLGVAALTTVATVILNLDGFLTRD